MSFWNYARCTIGDTYESGANIDYLNCDWSFSSSNTLLATEIASIINVEVKYAIKQVMPKIIELKTGPKAVKP